MGYTECASDKHFNSGTAYVAPQVLVDVDHSLSYKSPNVSVTYTAHSNGCSDGRNIWTDCTHHEGPLFRLIALVRSLIPCYKVSSDEEAIKLMNNSPYGLTASVWTKDVIAFERLVDDIEAGTVFQNRCDFLDPALAWTGLKKSGRGISLSKYGAVVLLYFKPCSPNPNV